MKSPRSFAFIGPWYTCGSLLSEYTTMHGELTNPAIFSKWKLFEEKKKSDAKMIFSSDVEIWKKWCVTEMDFCKEKEVIKMTLYGIQFFFYRKHHKSSCFLKMKSWKKMLNCVLERDHAFNFDIFSNLSFSMSMFNLAIRWQHMAIKKRKGKREKNSFEGIFCSSFWNRLVDFNLKWRIQKMDRIWR